MVLDKGEIVGQGVHEELLAANEIYAEIYHSQLEEQRERHPGDPSIDEEVSS